ncbi:MAG: hypothetical protein J6M91_03620 [Methanobrevibacter sp.]|nr:hypothetical protein [Methanobrevibacter sp.]
MTENKRRTYRYAERIKCPYCGYMMRILKEKDDELLCYCASCKEDILITKKEDCE